VSRPEAPGWWARAVDLGFALVLAPIWLPPLLLGIVAAAISQGFPVFYRAERLGRHGRVFHMLKIRTMVRDADRLGPAISGSHDARITRVGKVLRATKIDELPQFLHVLSGEMSLVGPRPEAPSYLPFYTSPGHSSLRAKPGVTGYGALYFFLHEDHSGPEEFETFYVRELLPRKLVLDERCARELSVRPFRTTARLVGRTVLVVLSESVAGIALGGLLARRSLRTGVGDAAQNSPK
jgi:lipopolysaccharide/colanic/teichoic acid biosynthesis glycosyltransferase